MKLIIKVIPGAKENKIVEDVEDVSGHRNIRIRVNKPAEGGKANMAVIDILSKYLKVRKRDISIISGLSSRNKVIVVEEN